MKVSTRTGGFTPTPIKIGVSSRSERGFTLIEVLTVIIIISILIGVIYVGFAGARENARNKAMMSSLKETQLALELFKAQNGYYPIPPGGCGSTSAAPATGNAATGKAVSAESAGTYSSYNCPGTYIPGLAPEFIDELPSRFDSGNASCEILYIVERSGKSYKLMAWECYEGAASAAEGIQPGDEFARFPEYCASEYEGQSYANTNVDDFYETPAVYGGYRTCIEFGDDPDKY